MGEVVDIPQARWSSSPQGTSADADLSDAAARARALDVHTSFLVEAPAGSGKTGLLIQRFLALLGTADVSAPEQVLAVTFTRAATEEIRARVVGELRAAAGEVTPQTEFGRRTRVLATAVLERDRELTWQLLDSPRRLRVTTIDGLCAEIVRSVPALAGGPASWKPTEHAHTLYAEAARLTMLRLGERETPEQEALTSALRQLLLHRDGDLLSTEALLAEMLAHREQWSRLITFSDAHLSEEYLDQITLERLQNSLAQTISAHLTTFTQQTPGDCLDRLAALSAELALTERHPERLDHPLALCRDFVGVPPTSGDLLGSWKAMLQLLLTGSGQWRKGFNSKQIGMRLSKEQQSALKEIIETAGQRPGLQEAIQRCLLLPPAAYPSSDWQVTKSLLRVLRAAVRELEDVFQNRRSCDFAEFSILARRALEKANGKDVPFEGSADTRHLLLDEMQDTSYSQYDLLERFTAGWDGSARTVFLVGDPKQSIYLFRQARVERFIQIARSGRFGDLPLETLQLSANFRSQAAFLEEANNTFSRVFQSDGQADDIKYTPVTATRPAASFAQAEASFAWHLRELTGPIEQQRGLRAEVEAKHTKRMREVLEVWMARPLPSGRSRPWRLAVLVQKREALKRITEELRSGSPLSFRAVEIEPLQDRREILDVLALTRALLHPADRIAWLATLRAPWCGLTLADLHQLTGADDPDLRSKTVLTLLTERLSFLSHDGMLRVSRVVPRLREALYMLGEMRLPELVERTWRALGAEQYLDLVARQNVRTLLRLMRALDREKGFVEHSELEQRVKRLRAAPASGATQIDFMTIHGAKGLEWDVVLLPELDRGSPSPDSELLLWEELEHGGGLLLAPVQRKGETSSPLQRWLRHVQASRLAAERRRLFYVAATRAREQLHLFSCVALRRETSTPEPGSLLFAAWPAAEAHLKYAREEAVLSLAASAEEDRSVGAKQPAVLERVPLEDKVVDFSSVDSQRNAPVEDGSLPYLHASPLPRAVGNVVHTLLEHLAVQAVQGIALEKAAQSVEASRSQTKTLLRQEGVGPSEIAEARERVQQALLNTLRSAIGRWLLLPHLGGEVEWPLTHWQEKKSSLRADRVFRAGDRPGISGSSQLWIVDYKTSAPGPSTTQDFLEKEQARYREQLEGYAVALRGMKGSQAGSIALGLWFPFLAQLVWWYAPQPGTLALSAWHIAGDT